MVKNHLKISVMGAIWLVVAILLGLVVTVAAENNEPIKKEILTNLTDVESKKFIDDFLSLGECQSFSWPATIKNVFKMGKPAVRPLILLLDDKDPHTRTLALLCLIEITNEMTGVYVDIFEDKKRDAIIKSWEQWWNQNKDKAQIDWLIDSLYDKEMPNRVNRGIVMLGNLGDPKAIPHLKPFLKNSDLNSQYNAIYALAQLKDEASIPYLIQRLKSDLRFVRSDMFSFLKKMTGLDFGYMPDGPVEERNKSILKWEQWLKEKQAKAGNQ